MSATIEIDELEFAALMSSKICHDALGPVGAIYNGLEVLDDDNDPSSRAYALDVIRSFTEQASAKLQFARLAFGAAGSAGAEIDLTNSEQIARGYLGDGKHKLQWTGPVGHMAKNKVKLLLNMVACAVTALPRGGDIKVAIEGSLERPTLVVRCTGQAARPPQYLPDFINGQAPNGLDALTIQPYYTCRLASASGLRLSVRQDGDDIVVMAAPH